jgi:hypothetical protein
MSSTSLTHEGTEIHNGAVVENQLLGLNYTPMDKLAEVGDYVADTERIEKENLILDIEFEKVKESAREAHKTILEGHPKLHRHLAELYVFSRSVSGTDYLQQKLKIKNGKKYRAKVSHGYNYAPIIDLVWSGLDGEGLPSTKSNRFSVALNRLNDAYLRDFQLEADPVSCLVEYIRKKGGIDGLINDKSLALPSDSESQPDHKNDATMAKHAAEIAAKSIHGAYALSLDEIRKKANLPSVIFQTDIVVNDDDVALVLVRKSADGFRVVNTVSNRDQIAPVMTEQYLRDYAALPRSLRFIAEILTSQCLPCSMQPTYKLLLDEVGRHPDGSSKTAKRRLTFKQADHSFLLSLTGSQSGLVTVGKPSNEILKNPAGDLALAGISRKELETHLVCTRNFRGVSVDPLGFDDPIPVSNSEPDHVVSIGVLNPKPNSELRRISVMFLREGINSMPVTQVDVNVNSLGKPLWQRTVPSEWFRAFNSKFTNNWVKNHAEHITREHQSVLQLVLTKTTMKVRFFKVNDIFDLEISVEVPAGQGIVDYRTLVLSRDFAIAMHGLSDLPITGTSKIELFEGVFRISYQTDAGQYELYIPTADSAGFRTTQCFGRYCLKSHYEATDFEDADEVMEGTFQ